MLTDFSAAMASGADNLSGNGRPHLSHEYMLYTPDVSQEAQASWPKVRAWSFAQRDWVRLKDEEGSPFQDEDERLRGEVGGDAWQCPEEVCPECGSINMPCEPTCSCYKAAKSTFGSRYPDVLRATWPSWRIQGGWRQPKPSSMSSLSRAAMFLAEAKEHVAGGIATAKERFAKTMIPSISDVIPRRLRDPTSCGNPMPAWDKFTGSSADRSADTTRFGGDDTTRCQLEQLVNDYLRHSAQARSKLIRGWRDGLEMKPRDVQAIREMAATYIRNTHPPLTPYHAYSFDQDYQDPFRAPNYAGGDWFANGQRTDPPWIPVDSTYHSIYVQQWVKTRDDAVSLVHLAGANVIFFHDQRQAIRLPTCAPIVLKCCPAMSAVCHPLSRCCGQVVDGSHFDDEEAMAYRSTVHLEPRYQHPVRKPVGRVRRWLWGNQARNNLNINDAFGNDTRDAKLCRFNSHLRIYMQVRSGWADDILRAHTLDANGWVPGEDCGFLGYSSVSHTRVEAVANRIQLPSNDQILSQLGGVNFKPRIDRHTYAAHARYVVQKEIVSKFNMAGFFLYNLSLSSTSRDVNVSGGARPIHTVKDFAHHPRPIDLGRDHHFNGQVNNIPYPMLPDYTDVVYLSIDDLVYHDMQLLEQLSGNPMVFWTSYYPQLCGSTMDCTYYCTGPESFTEVIGTDQYNFSYPNQRQWNFMANDVIAIETMDKSRFTLYRVRVTPRPDLLKQLVILAPMHTVNLPLAVVEKLIHSTKGHPFVAYARDGRLPRFGPCDNIVVSSGIVIMRNGTPRHPTLCFMFEGNIDPDGCIPIPEKVFRWLQSLHERTGGRKLTAAEFNRRLIAYIIDTECSEEERKMAEHWLPIRVAAFVELMKAIASYEGVLPNMCYFVSCPERDASSAANDMEHEKAKAVSSAPSIAPANPNHAVQDANASATIKEKADSVTNTVRYSKDWKRINKHVIGRICCYMSEQTGFEQHTITLGDREEVLDRRNRPAQVAREDTAANGPVFDGGTGIELERGETNVKGETLHKGKPAPRAVNNPPYEVSIETGRLALALEPMLKKLACYDPSQTPEGIGQGLNRVYTMALEAQRQSVDDKHPDIIKFNAQDFTDDDSGSCMYGKDGRTIAVCCIDYTNADLLHSQDSNMILETIIRHFFHPSHLKEALDIYRSAFNMIMQCGPYQRSSKWTNCSGTGITTILNTCVFMVRDVLITLVAYVFRSMEMHSELSPGSYLVDRKGKEIEGPPPKLTYDAFIKHLDRIGVQENKMFKTRLDAHVDGDRDFFPQGDFKLSEVILKNDKKIYKNDLIRYAWKYIGCFFGDDSVRSAYPYLGVSRVRVAMKYVGLQDGMQAKLDAVCDPSKHEPIEYLSRVFFNLHAGSSASYCKIEKALAKLTVSSARDPWKYVSKLLGYLTTDWRTPVVGAYLQAVCRMYGLEFMAHVSGPSTLLLKKGEILLTDNEGRVIHNPYGDPDKLETGLHDGDPAIIRLFTTDRDLYYKLLKGSYPWSRDDTEAAYEHVSKELGINSIELKQYDAMLASQSDWQGIKRCALPGTLKEFAPSAYWPEHSCNKWQDVVEPLTVGSCDYGRRHPADAPNTTRVYPFSTLVHGLSPQMIDFDDPKQVQELQDYVASCSSSTPPPSNAFSRKLVDAVKIKTEAVQPSQPVKVPPYMRVNKLFKDEAELERTSAVMQEMLGIVDNSQDEKTTTIRQKPKNKSKKQKINKCDADSASSSTAPMRDLPSSQ